MDVHLPHEPLHTWKDFWIHIGTITVGLLIAIGLEQSVEAMHRLHEKHVLQQELREEGEHNTDLMRTDFERMQLVKTALIAHRRDVEEMIASNGRIKHPYQDLPNTGTIALPSEGVWDSAKASGRIALLPDNQTAVYAFLYLQNEWLKTEAMQWTSSETAKQEFERRFDPVFATTGNDTHPDLGSMSIDDLKAYSIVLNKEIAQQDAMADFLRFFDAVNKTVLDGAQTQDEVIRRVDVMMNAQPQQNKQQK